MIHFRQKGARSCMARQKNHPLYIAFLVIMVLICLLGVLLLIGGSLRQPSLPPLWRIPNPIAQWGWLFHG